MIEVRLRHGVLRWLFQEGGLCGAVINYVGSLIQPAGVCAPLCVCVPASGGVRYVFTTVHSCRVSCSRRIMRPTYVGNGFSHTRSLFSHFFSQLSPFFFSQVIPFWFLFHFPHSPPISPSLQAYSWAQSPGLGLFVGPRHLDQTGPNQRRYFNK